MSGVQPKVFFASSSAPASTRNWTSGRLIRQYGAVQRCHSVPTGIAHAEFQQVVHVPRKSSSVIFSAPQHGVVAEIRVSIDTIAQFESQLQRFEAFCLGDASERTRAFSFVVIKTSGGHQRGDADLGVDVWISAVLRQAAA